MSYLIIMAVHRDGAQPTGSIDLHCDPTASHNLKLHDACDSRKLSQRRKRTNTKGDARRNEPRYCLRYSKSDNCTWNPLYVSPRPRIVLISFIDILNYSSKTI